MTDKTRAVLKAERNAWRLQAEHLRAWHDEVLEILDVELPPGYVDDTIPYVHEAKRRIARIAALGERMNPGMFSGNE